MDTEALFKPDVSERIVPNSNGHLGAVEVTNLFDRLWKMSPRRTGFVVELNMQDVKTLNVAFSHELEFYRRELQRHVGTVRLLNGDQIQTVSGE